MSIVTDYCPRCGQPRKNGPFHKCAEPPQQPYDTSGDKAGGVSEVRDSEGRVVAHALAEPSPEPDVDYVLTVVWEDVE